MRESIILHGQMDCDDSTLVKMYNTACKELKKNKKLFEKERSCYDKNNYLSYAITRLAYEFAKEQHGLLCDETTKRGLAL